MLENIIHDKAFALLMKNNIKELIGFLFQKEQNFGILCKIEDVSFAPELPEDINNEFRPLTLFFLAGYTFETASIDGERITFEAGFGHDNFGSIVSVPLLSILQIIIDETPIFINISSYQEEATQKSNIDENGVENSMMALLSNPENAKFIK